MSTHVIEVELRGPLDAADYTRLLSYLEGAGAKPALENRFLIDYSTFIEGIGGRKLDVRARITNGRPEIVIKRGAFGGAAREEAVAPISSTSIGPAVAVLALLGYKRGVACDRGIARYRVGDIEIAVQDVRRFDLPGEIHSRFFEVEIQTDHAGKLIAETRLREFAAAIGLRIFSSDEWNAYVAVMNAEANGVYDFDADPLEKIAKLGTSP